MDQFIAGAICGAIGLALLGSPPEPKIVEVLPQNYQIVTGLSKEICSGPTGRETIAYETVRTQTVDYTEN